METCARFVQSGDPVLFLEDGVYSVAKNTRVNDLVGKLVEESDVYVLSPDLEARGIEQIMENVKEIDYEGFVDLVEKHQVNSWF